MDIPLRLYREYYKENIGTADVEQASTHWQNFSKNFHVEMDKAGNVKNMQGYGFGESDKSDIISRVSARIGNALVGTRLHYTGLKRYLRTAKDLVESMGLQFSQDAFRQACTSFFLQTKTYENKVQLRNILIIGDGHGILAGLLAQAYPDARIYLIDLGATLYFQASYLGKRFTNRQHTLLSDPASARVDSGFFYCPADKLESFNTDNIDLAINVASMQEMTIEIVSNYFSLLRKRNTKLFYCCNRLEKRLPDGKLTRFAEYPWKEADKHIVDEKCPWHQFFFGISSAENIKFLGILPVPLLHKYDGMHWHRLSFLAN